MAIIGSLPYTLTNGQTADATQVMADFAAIVNGVNSNAAALTSVIGDAYNYAADTGTVNNIVISPSTGAPASYVDGGRMRTKAANTNTSTTMTVKFGSLGTKSVVIDAAGTLPPVGCVIQNMHYVIEYDSTQDKCILMNPSRATGSFTGTLATGFTTTPTGTINYAILPDGKTVQVFCPAGLTATSNTAGWTVTGAPPIIQAAHAWTMTVGQLQDNGGRICGSFSGVNGGTWTALGGGSLSTAGFTASGTKGIPAAWWATYSLD